LKVLLLVHGLPVGGTEVMVCHLARYLRGAGVEVEVGCLDLVGELGEELRRDGFVVVEFGRRPGFDVRLPARIARQVQQSGYDVVHAHQYTCFFYAALAKLLRRVPLVFTEHGRFYPDLASWKRQVFTALFSRQAAHVTAVSAGVRQSLLKVERFRGRDIEVLYNGIDVERFTRASERPRAALRERCGLPIDAEIIGTVGRLDTIKNHTLLLHAFSRLRKASSQSLLAIVGDGPERSRLEDRARHLGLGDHVLFLGQRQNLEEVFASFDVFCLSSLSEGTPMTLLEAMAARVPIVSTGVGGIPEILESEQEAWLIKGMPPDCRDLRDATESDYVTKFAEALKRVLLDADLRSRLASGALARVRREFSLDTICQRYLEIFGKVAGKHPDRQPASQRG
jgi:glycosyltransferase involved in cell wall biosynthesis